jgi:hypothetical protein
MKRIFVPRLGRHVVIGACKLPSPHRPRIRLSSYIDKATIPTAPASCDYTTPAMPVIQNVEGNDSVGDCVEAEEAHFISVVTGNANSLFTYTPAMTLAMYSALTGYVPGNPATDQGTDPIACLNYFTQKPYADGSINAGYAEVDATNQAEVEFAISAFGNLKMWVGLPDPWINPFPSSNGFVWDVAPVDQNNGHCIGSPGYNSPKIVGSNSQGVQVMTWGLIGTVTWPALAAAFSDAAGGGLAVRVTTDWVIKNSGKTPSGFAYSDLCSDFNALFGKNIPVPAPAPSPVPTPTPAAGVTLAQAQEWGTYLINRGRPLLTKQTAVNLVLTGLASSWPSATKTAAKKKRQ